MYQIYDKLLAEWGISNYKVSKETGISQATLSDWKNGKSTPKNDKLQIIADYFEVTIDYLLYGFDKGHFTSLVNLVRDKRSMKDFAADTGLDEYYLTRLCSGVEYNQPTIDTIVTLAIHNRNDWLVDAKSLFESAGYDLEEISEDLIDTIPTELVHHYVEQGMTAPDMVIAYLKFEKAKHEDVMAEKVGESEKKPYYELTEKDEANIKKQLKKVINGEDVDMAFAAFDGSILEDLNEEDRELLINSWANTFRLTRRMAKEKFTPHKYRD